MKLITGISLATLAALSLASCRREEAPVPDGAGSIRAVILDTKVHIEDGRKCRWDVGDAISLSPQSAVRVDKPGCTLTTSDSGTHAVFTGSVPEGLSTWCAAYPAAAVTCWNPKSNDCDKGRCRFLTTIKSTQTVKRMFLQDGLGVYIDPDVLWLGGWSNDKDNIPFQPLGTYLRFVVPPTARYSLRSISVSADGAKVAGATWFSYSGGKWGEEFQGTLPSATLVRGEGLPLAPGIYYLAIHKSTQYTRLDFVFTDTAGQTAGASVTSSQGGFPLEMGKIYDVGTLPDTLFGTEADPPSGDGEGVETYVYAPSIAHSTAFAVSVEGREQTVFTTSEPDICAFGCPQTVTVEISFPGRTVTRVDVRPKSLDFSETWDGTRLTLRMAPKDRVVVECDGDTGKPLFLFANPVQEKPADNDDDVIVFKAGTVSDVGTLDLPSGRNVYIEGGAWVTGYIRATSAQDIVIRGCGVFDSRETAGVPMRITSCGNVSLSGIITLNRIAHTTHFQECSGIDIDNYKVVAEYNTTSGVNGHENDALNILSSHTASVRHCFSYCHDDAFCLKSIAGSPAYDIHYEDCIAWNVHGGNAFEIGYEVSSDIYDVSYKDIRSIHRRGNTNLLRSADIGIHNGGSATVSDVSYENVYLEEPTDKYALMFLIFDRNQDVDAYVPGHIRNVQVRNLHILGEQPYGSRIHGYDDSHRIGQVQIDGMYVLGAQVNTCEDGAVSVQYADVTIK